MKISVSTGLPQSQASEEQVVLYRGISVPGDEAQRIRDRIISEGMRGTEGRQWRFTHHDLRDRLEDFFGKSALSTADTRAEDIPRFDAICACGDETGAAYYALKHNRHRRADEVSYVIRFSATLKDVYVDGRDFLYTAFQMFDRKTSERITEQNEVLRNLYGSGIQRYFSKAVSSSDLRYRWAMCDLACQDPQVLKGHLRNQTLIGGRFGTVFRSAFFVRAPIPSEQILAVSVACGPVPRQEYSLEAFF